ncbi:MAG: asparagine synthase (glutamine-hydrolyzing) [Acidimicrobiales bacterium]
MCGIFATTRPDLWQARLPQVLRLLRHRGPDDEGTWRSRDGGVLLAHTRLEIIGLGSAGSQPVSSEGGSLALSYNGEFYNYREVARDLHLTSAESDTRVLCELLDRQGHEGLNRVRGMYAAAIWDDTYQTLSICRDRWGVKPAYVLRHPSGGVSVASEIPVLLESPDAWDIDPVGLAHYLAYGHTGNVATVFRTITKVPPGTTVAWRRRDGSWQESQRLLDPLPATSEPALAFRHAIADSVRAHMTADVEVGVFLSGGLDSTLLASVAAELASPVRTFTLSFPGYPHLDESAFAEANARSLGVEFNRVPVSVTDMRDAADTFLRVHGEPYADAAVLPLMALSRVAGQEVKVVLAGEGADEMFGGYGRYRIASKLDHRAFRIHSRLTRHVAPHWAWRRGDLPRQRAFEAVLWGSGMRAHGALLGSEAGWLDRADLPSARAAIELADSAWEGLAKGTGLSRARAYDETRWLPNVYLEKTDRATMAYSLEARVPYLDPVVATTVRAMTSPPKSPIRDELYRRLPQLRAPARKRGLAVPLAALVDGVLGEAGRFQVGSAESVLARVLGRGWQRTLRVRAERSPACAFRVAMLGRWEQLLSPAGRRLCD